MLTNHYSSIENCCEFLLDYSKKTELGKTPGEIAANVWYFGHTVHSLERLILNTHEMNKNQSIINQIEELKEANTKIEHALQLNDRSRHTIHHCIQNLHHLVNH
jgi:hypothetical protein